MLHRQFTACRNGTNYHAAVAPALQRTRTVLCSAQAASAAADTAESVKQLLTRRSYAPPRFAGPIKVTEIPGKRYGLVATENLPVGALLLVVPALAVGFGPAGAAPSNAELVAQLEGQQLEPWQLQWLRLLYRQPVAAAAAVEGTADYTSNPADASQQQQQQQQAKAEATAEQLELLQQLLMQGEAATSSSSSTAAAAAAGAPSSHTDPAAAAAAADELSIVSVINPFTLEQLQQIIAENAYSEVSEDIGASLLRELDPEGITGFWPEYALLNHSCAPNTIAVVVGRFLILRAVTPIMSGEELTGSYLGKLGFSPVAVRRAYLSGIYGFHCQCPRCMCEQSTFPTVYYPADNALLRLVDPNNNSSSSSSDSPQQQQAGFMSRLSGLLGFGNKQQQQQQVNPSLQHTLLLQLHADTQELAAAVQEAAVADTKRQDRQLNLLATITEKLNSALDAIESVNQQLQQLVDRDDGIGSVQQAAKWLLAAIYPLLDLRVQLLELLLSSGDLPVDDRFLLYDEQITAADGMLQGAASRQVASAGAAAAGRLSLLKGRKSKRSKHSSSSGGGLQGLVDSVLSGWGSGQQASGPVTKRQLLALYVEGLQQCVVVTDAMARGSDIHIVTALKYMDAVRQLHGVEAEETRLAEGLCSRAHAARYGVMQGQEEQQLLLRLIAARRRQLLGISLARKMSVLAWESSAVRF